jgi:hypothetical protein
MLADRESDITEVLDYCRCQTEFDWVIRIDGSRILNKDKFRDPSIAVREALGNSKAFYHQTLDIRDRTAWGSESLKHRPGKADREAREVKVSVHAGEVTKIPAPVAPTASPSMLFWYAKRNPIVRTHRSNACC